MMKTSKNPRYQSFHIDGISHISPNDAYQAMQDENTFAVDVREPDEIQSLRIDSGNVLFHPISKIMDRISYIPKDKTLIIVCSTGERSSKVVNLLIRQGFSNVANLDGGIVNWRDMKLPVLKSNRSVSGGCSSCGSAHSCGDSKKEAGCH